MEKRELIYDIDERTPEIEDVVRQAKEFILQALSIKELDLSIEQLNKLKIKLIDAVKIVVADELGVKLQSIECVIDEGVELPDYSDAGWQLVSRTDSRKGQFGKLFVAREFLENSVIYEFVKTLLHEFGHAKQDLKAERTGKYPQYINALDVDEDNELDKWLFLLKHQSDAYEYGADLFSFSKIQKWIKEAEAQGFSTSQLFQNKRWAIYGEYKRHLGFVKSWALRFVTAPLAVANGVLKNKRYSVYYATNVDEIYIRNVLNREKGLRTILHAEERVCELREQKMLSEKEMFELVDLYALFFARDVGVKDERIGVVVGYDKLERGVAYIPNEGAEENELLGMIVLPSTMIDLSVKEFDSQIRTAFSTFRDRHCVKEGKKLFIKRFRKNGKVVIEEMD